MGSEWDHWWSSLSVSMPFSAIFRHYFICHRVSPALCFLLWCTCVLGFHWDSFSEMLLTVQIAILLQRCGELWWIKIINQMTRMLRVRGMCVCVCVIMLHNPRLYTIMSVQKSIRTAGHTEPMCVYVSVCVSLCGKKATVAPPITPRHDTKQ